MVESNAVPGFLPSVNGLHFPNRFPPGPTLTFGPIDPRWVGIGDASAGLCGGMSWLVRERFQGGLPVLEVSEPPINGSPLFRALVRRQVLSLDWLRTPMRFWWTGALPADRAAELVRDREWPAIRADIDAGRLSMVGLVRHQGASPWRLTESHQVLAYAYEASSGGAGGVDAGSITIRIYDPNLPDRDDVVITEERYLRLP